jgi:N-acetylglucosaminyldiphosphoundecaprenol N-acetyl-beta-D-mannosaminyltransferase
VPDRAVILRIGVGVITLDRAVSTIEQWIEGRTQKSVCCTGAHGFVESCSDARLRHIHNEAGMVRLRLKKSILSPNGPVTG